MILLNKYEDKTKKTVIYSKKENAFDTIPKENSDISLLVAYINIGFDSETMVANQIWGFSPQSSWTEETVQPPDVECFGAMKLGIELEPGSWRIDRKKTWVSFFNPENGWLCIGEPMVSIDDRAIAFFDNAISVVNLREELKAIWIKLVMQ